MWSNTYEAKQLLKIEVAYFYSCGPQAIYSFLMYPVRISAPMLT